MRKIRRPWKSWELEYVREHQNTDSLQDVARHLKRSVGSVKTMLYRTQKMPRTISRKLRGVKESVRRSPRPWTDGEVEDLKSTLLQLYESGAEEKGGLSDESAQAIGAGMGRSASSVRGKAANLGLLSPQRGAQPKRGAYEASEDKYLLENWGILRTTEIAWHLCRSVASVRKRHRQLQERRQETAWTPKQERLLREGWGRVRQQELAQQMGCSLHYLRKWACAMSLPPLRKSCTRKRWTDTEDQTLRTLWQATPSLPEVAQTLGRSESSVQWRLTALGLRSPKFQRRLWSEEEERIMQEEYGLVRSEDLAAKLERAVFSVKSKAQKMGLTRRRRG